MGVSTAQGVMCLTDLRRPCLKMVTLVKKSRVKTVAIRLFFKKNCLSFSSPLPVAGGILLGPGNANRSSHHTQAAAATSAHLYSTIREDQASPFAPKLFAARGIGGYGTRVVKRERER